MNYHTNKYIFIMACGTCGTNTLIIGKAGQNGSSNSVQCPSSCSSLGPVDPLDKNKLGPRKKREKVREQIRDYILLMLGAPVLNIELDDQALDLCVDQALAIIEYYAPNDFFSYYTFLTVPGKSVYEMPPDIGYIRNVFWKKTATFAFQSSDLNGAIPIEYFYPGGAYASIQGGLIDPIQPIWGRLGEWTLYKGYEQMFSRASSNIGGWEWVGGYGTIKLYPIPHTSSKVIVHYIQKNKDWAQVSQAMQEGALTYAKEIVGRIRSRYKNPPGPNGGIQQDGEALLQEAREDRKQWMEDLIYKFGDPVPGGISMD